LGQWDNPVHGISSSSSFKEDDEDFFSYIQTRVPDAMASTRTGAFSPIRLDEFDVVPDFHATYDSWAMMPGRCFPFSPSPCGGALHPIGRARTAVKMGLESFSRNSRAIQSASPSPE